MRRTVVTLGAGVWMLLAGCGGGNSPQPEYRAWEVYLGDHEATHYSTLDQINLETVVNLQPVWAYHTGDALPEKSTQIQCNPIIVQGVLYATTPQLKVFALDAASGAHLWTFDPFAERDPSDPPPLHVNRGVAYWEDGEQRRIFFSAGSFLYALRPQDGQPAPSFGEAGRVDLRQGLGREPEGLAVAATSPGVVYEDLIIMGSRLSEGYGAAPGDIRAYDVRTGDIRWTFRTIPLPGDPGSETWPENAREEAGGANSWAGMTVDTERGWVFASTGSAAYDFYGGNRHGDNLYANSVLALNASNGKRIWHFQIVRHDLWDRDLPAPPNLVSVIREGKAVEAVAQITKSGHVFVLDRDTGEPLFPVEEFEVPASSLPGEQAAPTQILPLKPPPFARQRLSPEDLTQRTPEAHASVLRRLGQVRSEGQFYPPSLEGTVIFPGFDGGGEWGGAGFDPETGWLYVNSSEMAWILTMIPAGAGSQWASAGAQIYSSQCAFCHGADRQGDPRLNYPALVDLKTRLTASQVEQIIRRGVGSMPPVDLSSAEAAAVAEFVLDSRSQNLVLPDSGAIAARSPLPFIHTGWNRFLDPDGYPAVEPPWGTLTAIDLNLGELVWQVPLGQLDELTHQGLPPTGTENYGGPVVTAGGLVFIAATKDEKFRALDKQTGKVVWETKLPAGGYATPATFEIDGRQYVVIAAGGGKMGTPSGDTYIAFALERN